MENKRKLVTIRTVGKIYPIPKKDRIELITIDGWSCIAKKGEFVEGAECVYFEIDSFLQDEERYTFLGKTKEHCGKSGYRIRTMKLGGAISQGLALPLSMFPELSDSLEAGDDVTDILKVVKYDNASANPQRPGNVKAGNAAGKFPSFIPKTNQERIQNLPHYFDLHHDTSFVVELKMDGSSLTAYKTDVELPRWKRIINHIWPVFETQHFGVCSRNLELKRTANYEATFDNNGTKSTYAQSDFWDIVKQERIEDALPEGFAIQGELIGPRINGNLHKVTENQLYIFDVFDIENQHYLRPGERFAFLSKYLPNVKQVEHITTGYVFRQLTDFDAMLRFVDEVDENTTPIEGYVFKSIDGHTTFKCINNMYLLKKEH